MITNLYIKNFRSIKSLNIKNINNSLAFIGENSSGKSAILSALLIALGEKVVTTTDFRISKTRVREAEISIGIGLECDLYMIDRILKNFTVQDKHPNWFNKITNDIDKTGKRSTNSLAYKRDFRKKFKDLLNIPPTSRSIYFKITIDDINLKKEINIVNSTFNKIISNINISINELEEIFYVSIPPYAYLSDERNFNLEKLGEKNSTTNKLFNLLLQSIDKPLEFNSDIEKTPISDLSISQINYYLEKKVHQHTKQLMKQINERFKTYYKEDIHVDWMFTNKLYESLNIQTNFHLGEKDEIEFQSVGSGTRGLYKMVLLDTLLENQKYEDEPVLFLLEEPELYLYPKLEKQISKFITNLSQKNQVMLTTHSHMTVSNLNSGSLYKVERIKENINQIPITKINKINSSYEVMAMLGYDITYLIDKEFLFFVEGNDDEKAYSSLIKKIFPNLETKFIVMTSVSHLQAALNFNFLDLIKSRTKSIYLIDSDGTESVDRKEKAIKNIKNYEKNLEKIDFEKNIILTEYCMLECYTFEYKYLLNDLTEEDYQNRVHSFICNNKDNINRLLEQRCKNKQFLVTADKTKINEEFEIIRKYGFNKQLIRELNKIIGGSGFKKLSDLKESELRDTCKILIDKIKEIIES